MKRPTFGGSLLAALLASPGFGQTPPPAAAASPDPAAGSGDAGYHLIVFVPAYRGVDTSGYAGRVGEYDSLLDSGGGELTLTLMDRAGRAAWQAHGLMVSKDDYDVDSKLNVGKTFTLVVQARSLVHHLDDVPFGTNLSPDDILRTQAIPDGAVFGVKRTDTSVDARVKLPNTPVSLYFRGGWQRRSGQSQLQYFDMGSDTQCGACHSASRYRDLEYRTDSYTAGAELALRRGTIGYEHVIRTFEDAQPRPVDYYGSTLSLPDDELPAGVPDTLAGKLVHNLLPSHRTSLDRLRIRLPMSHTSSLVASASKGTTRNTDTSNPQNVLNADATLNLSLKKRARTTFEFHQWNQDNDFTPAYPLFGNPSFHRYWAGARLDYKVSSGLGVEGYYRYGHVTRSNAELWPQFYSPDNADLRRVIPESSSNTVGVDLRFHGGERWSLRPGYEWVGTNEPGYLTTPGTAHRAYLRASVSPSSRVSVSDDFSVLLQGSFPDIARRNRLYLNTAYLTLTLVPEWTLATGYTYLQNNLETDLVYGTDPLYQESLVPYKALSQGFTVTSSYAWRKRVIVSADLANTTAHSEFRPASVDNEFFPVVSWASDFSRVNVPQVFAHAAVEYRWPEGFNAGFQFRYGRYEDRVHPELTGRLSTYGVFVGKNW
jgi:hypothetical protein